MRVEIVAVGTELLLGQIADTNSAWLGQQLAANGVDSHFHQAVGDNRGRIVQALRTALERSDAVIACGGLGPTQDDITRDALAELMDVALVRRPEIVTKIASLFASRGRTMPATNERQADVPVGATVIEQVAGTAPGLICPVGAKVVYAVPGVPREMAEMFTRGILPDLQRRMDLAGEKGVIISRVLRTWGTSESKLAEVLQGRVDALDAELAAGSRDTVTLAFLASGIEGIKVRLTARARTSEDARDLLAREEARVRDVLERRLGDVVFGVDAETMEHAVAALLANRGWSLGVAESLTGGLIASRLVDVVGSSAWFRGGIVAYATDVKRSLLGVAQEPAVSAGSARQMAEQACRVLGSDVGLATTGVAGPAEQDGRAPGTVFVGLAMAGRTTAVHELNLPGSRPDVRVYSVISALDLLRRALTAGAHDAIAAG